MTKDAAQQRNWTFYEAVIFGQSSSIYLYYQINLSHKGISNLGFYIFIALDMQNSLHKGAYGLHRYINCTPDIVASPSPLIATRLISLWEALGDPE